MRSVEGHSHNHNVDMNGERSQGGAYASTLQGKLKGMRQWQQQLTPASGKWLLDLRYGTKQTEGSINQIACDAKKDQMARL